MAHEHDGTSMAPPCRDCESIGPCKSDLHLSKYQVVVRKSHVRGGRHHEHHEHHEKTSRSTTLELEYVYVAAAYYKVLEFVVSATSDKNTFYHRNKKTCHFWQF